MFFSVLLSIAHETHDAYFTSIIAVGGSTLAAKDVVSWCPKASKTFKCKNLLATEVSPILLCGETIPSPNKAQDLAARTEPETRFSPITPKAAHPQFFFSKSLP